MTPRATASKQAGRRGHARQRARAPHRIACTYKVTDGTASVDGKVTVSVANKVWYVKNNQAPGGNGRSTEPFDTLVEAQTAGASGDTIYVFKGDGTTTGQNAGITLKSNQRLLGEPVPLVVGGDTLYTGVAANRPAMSGNTGGSTTFSGTTKTLNTGASAAFSSTGGGHTINLTNGGLDIDTTSGSGLSATGGGTMIVTTGANPNTIDSTTGTALNVASTNIGASGLTFQSISAGTTAGSAGNGVVLDNTGSSGGLT